VDKLKSNYHKKARHRRPRPISPLCITNLEALCCIYCSDHVLHRLFLNYLLACRKLMPPRKLASAQLSQLPSPKHIAETKSALSTPLRSSAPSNIHIYPITGFILSQNSVRPFCDSNKICCNYSAIYQITSAGNLVKLPTNY
jgi:hypothetical protein